MEKKVINYFCHDHPLTLTENASHAMDNVDCYGCGNPTADVETAYVCMQEQCRSKFILHKKCGELPNQIWHPKHPHHPVNLFDFHGYRSHLCDVCRCNIYNATGYRCRDCDFDIDITCKKVSIDALLEEERKKLQHPGHSDHPLTLMRKPATRFYCDGCGEEGVDMAYICSSCEFWVHKSCALLPFSYQSQHHHHQLSLAFSFPEKYLKGYSYKCEICDKLLDLTCWVYFCGDCRYYAHLKCVGSAAKPYDDSNLNEDRNDDLGVMVQFPLHAHDISKELITRFVMREKGLDCIPDANGIGTSNDSSFVDYHEHPLSLVLESFHYSEKDDDEEEGENDEVILICEACVTPISSPPYYHCVSCGYFIHFICCLLPKNICSTAPPLQLLGTCQEKPNNNHKFRLFSYYSKSIHKDVIPYRCDFCGLSSNGMGYECGDCRMRIDVKCASLPKTITHAFHSHKSLILTRMPPPQEGTRKKCRACLFDIYDGQISYCCSSDDCGFALHLKCAQQPRSVIKREWEKHPLLLTSDASLDHPSDFFCEFCEREIHPKKWMHFCRQCDVSFHIGCLETASGVFRNIRFGRVFKMDGIHPHPLRFNYITLKKRCDVCSHPVYSRTGYECVPCYYVVCHRCGLRELRECGII